MTTQTGFRPIIQKGEREFRFPARAGNLHAGKTARFCAVLSVVLVLSSCALRDLAASSGCSIDTETRVTIDAEDAEPQAVFDRLGRELDCPIPVFPGVWKHVTLHAQNETVAEILADVCTQSECRYVYNGTHLSIWPLMEWDKSQMRAQAEWEAKFRIRLPQGMRFEDAALSRVLEEISKASGLEITPWEGEGDRKVTLDVSGMTVDEALEAAVRQTGGEGVVLVKTWNGGTAQHRLVDKP